jgi:hypothetical protein
MRRCKVLVVVVVVVAPAVPTANLPTLLCYIMHMQHTTKHTHVSMCARGCTCTTYKTGVLSASSEPLIISTAACVDHDLQMLFVAEPIHTQTPNDALQSTHTQTPNSQPMSLRYATSKQTCILKLYVSTCKSHNVKTLFGK